MKTIKLRLIMLSLFMTIGMAGCKDKDNLDVFENTAIVTYSEPAVDGCGWKIHIDQKEYHPISLDDNYKINGLEVNIKYNLLPSVWECSQWTSREFQEIKIINITEIK